MKSDKAAVKTDTEAITAPVLLLVEGQDEEYLVQKMAPSDSTRMANTGLPIYICAPCTVS